MTKRKSSRPPACPPIEGGRDGFKCCGFILTCRKSRASWNRLRDKGKRGHLERARAVCGSPYWTGTHRTLPAKGLWLQSLRKSTRQYFAARKEPCMRGRRGWVLVLAAAVGGFCAG